MSFILFKDTEFSVAGYECPQVWGIYKVVLTPKGSLIVTRERTLTNTMYQQTLSNERICFRRSAKRSFRIKRWVGLTGLSYEVLAGFSMLGVM